MFRFFFFLRERTRSSSVCVDFFISHSNRSIAISPFFFNQNNKKVWSLHYISCSVKNRLRFSEMSITTWAHRDKETKSHSPHIITLAPNSNSRKLQWNKMKCNANRMPYTSHGMWFYESTVKYMAWQNQQLRGYSFG